MYKVGLVLVLWWFELIHSSFFYLGTYFNLNCIF